MIPHRSVLEKLAPAQVPVEASPWAARFRRCRSQYEPGSSRRCERILHDDAEVDSGLCDDCRPGCWPCRGWDLFDAGTGNLHVERCDECSQYDSDEDAWWDASRAVRASDGLIAVARAVGDLGTAEEPCAGDWDEFPTCNCWPCIARHMAKSLAVVDGKPVEASPSDQSLDGQGPAQ